MKWISSAGSLVTCVILHQAVLLVVLLQVSLVAVPVQARQSSAESLISSVGYEHQRQGVVSNAFPWRAIGRVNLAGVAHCTGTLVAEDVVLTAAHCLWNRKAENWFPLRYVSFIAGMNRQMMQGVAKVMSVRLAPGFMPLRGAEERQVAQVMHDWALLKLDSAIGRELGYLNILASGELQLNDGVVQAGYQAGRAEVLTAEYDCRVKAVYESVGLVRNTCVTAYGDSGGPLLVRRMGRWFLAGLHSGKVRQNESMAVSAAHMSHSHDWF